MLEIRDLRKTYAGGVLALKGVSLDATAGVFGLLGPNGAGKTTLMKILATLLAPDSGAAAVGGVDLINDRHAARTALGYLPQEFGLYPTLTAEQTLDYFARLKGVADASERRATIAALLERVNLSEARGRKVGNFFVLFCCMAGFALTLLVLQAFQPAGMVVLPARVLPYLKHFFFFVVVSHLALAALCFTVGTLSRNVKLVYGLATSSYVLYLAWQLFLKNLSPRLRVLLDPLLFNVGADASRGRTAAFLDQLTVSYSADMLANRALMLLVAAACLTILYLRFSRAEQSRRNGDGPLTLLNLAPERETIHAGNEGFVEARRSLDRASFDVESDAAPTSSRLARRGAALPSVRTECVGARASLRQLGAALAVECRLLREERGLAVLLLSLVLFALVGATAFALQLFKGHGPLELQPYLVTYTVILLPTAVFMVAAVVALNVLLRDKYLACAACLAVGGGLFYLYGQGYKHWLYNPALYELWSYRDLAHAGDARTLILTHRLYCLALAALLLSLAHLFFARESTHGLLNQGRPTGRAWAALLALASATMALVSGFLINV